MSKTITVSAAERDAAAAVAAAEERAEALDQRRNALLDAYADASDGLTLTEEADLLHSLYYGVDAATRMRATNRLTYTVGDEAAAMRGESTEAVFRCGGIEYRIVKTAAKPEVQATCDDLPIHDQNGVAWKTYDYASTAANVPAALNNIRLSMGGAARLVAETANAIKTETKSESKPRAKSADSAALAELKEQMAQLMAIVKANQAS